MSGVHAVVSVYRSVDRHAPLAIGTVVNLIVQDKPYGASWVPLRLARLADGLEPVDSIHSFTSLARRAATGNANRRLTAQIGRDAAIPMS